MTINNFQITKFPQNLILQIFNQDCKFLELDITMFLHLSLFVSKNFSFALISNCPTTQPRLWVLGQFLL